MATGGWKPNQTITGINMTPLVDITLVLLIIFMLTAKLVVSRALPMDLPRAATGADVPEVFEVALAADGSTEVDGSRILDDRALLSSAQAARSRHAELRAVVRADGSVAHRRVMQALDILRQAGVSRVAFAVTPGPAQDVKTAPGYAAP